MSSSQARPSGAQAPGASDERRSQILKAALDVIVDKGYADTRIADVAERVEVSPALVMYYFKTKDALLAEATRYAEDRWYDEGTRRMKALDSAAARLEELVRLTCLPQVGEALSESWSVWLDLWAEAIRHDAVRKVREEFDEHWRETIRQVVRDGQAAGEFDAVDVDDFVVAFSALLDGFAVQIALGDPVVGTQRAFELSMRHASATLGFLWQPPRAARTPAGRSPSARAATRRGVRGRGSTRSR